MGDIEAGLTKIVMTELHDPLRELDSLVAKSKLPRSYEAWRPSGNPDHDLAAHDVQVLEHELAELKDALAEQRQATNALKDQVQSVRHKVEDNERKLSDTLELLDTYENTCDRLQKIYPLPDEAFDI